MNSTGTVAGRRGRYQRPLAKMGIVAALLSAGIGIGIDSPASATEVAGEGQSVSKSVRGLTATMADRIYQLGGPSSHGTGALLNPAALDVAADGGVYFLAPSKGNNYRIMRMAEEGPVFVGEFHGSQQRAELARIAVGPQAVYISYLANGTALNIAALDRESGELISNWALGVTDAKAPVLGGLEVGEIGNQPALVYSINHQVSWASIHADGTFDPDGVVAGVANKAGFAGDGRPASQTETLFNNPQGMAFDNNGFLLVADSGNNRIRQIGGLNKPAEGVVTTIAGTGQAGYSGDGQPGLDASFKGITGLAVDKNNNIYVADTGNGKIRLLDGYRTVTTVVGSSQDPIAPLVPGTIAPNATLREPAAVDVLPNGSLAFTSRTREDSAESIGWQSAPLASLNVEPNVLPSWVGAANGSTGFIKPRGDEKGRSMHSFQLPSTFMPTLYPNADGTKWESADDVTLMKQGVDGAPFTLTASAKGQDASHAKVSVEYWVTNPITFSNVLFLHDVTVSYTAADGTTYSGLLPNGLSFAYVRGYNQSYVAQSPDTNMSWGDFRIPELLDAKGNAYQPADGEPSYTGDWVMNTGITVRPTYSR